MARLLLHTGTYIVALYNMCRTLWYGVTKIFLDSHRLEARVVHDWFMQLYYSVQSLPSMSRGNFVPEPMVNIHYKSTIYIHVDMYNMHSK